MLVALAVNVPNVGCNNWPTTPLIWMLWIARISMVPFAPTSIREFARSDKVGALMRVHQSSNRPARQVSVITRVIDEEGKPVMEAPTVYEPSRFADGKAVEHRFELALSALAPGDYLLQFAVSSGMEDTQAQREVRFSVR